MSGSSIRRIPFVESTPNASSAKSEEEASRDDQAAVAANGSSPENRISPSDCLMIDNVPVPPSLDPRAMPDFVGFPKHSAKSSAFGRIVFIIAFALAIISFVQPRLPPVSIIVTRPPGEEPRLSLPQSPTGNPATAEPTGSKRQHLGLIKQPQALPSDQPYPIGTRLSTPQDGAVFVISGLSPGTKISPDRPSTPDSWLISANDLRDAVIIPPPGFAGTMNVTVELRQADGVTADRQTLPLEWSSTVPPGAADVPAALRLEGDEIARLMKQGRQLLANGQIAPARLIFQRVAEAGEASAALALAETFDGSVLERVGAKGVLPDPVSARTWYEKAASLGATEARRRLDTLPEPVK